MSAERDNLIDRRRLKRKLTMWQAGALVALLLLVIVGMGKMWSSDQPHIARISVNGVIADNFSREALIKTLAENNNAKALVVRINSPGGTVAGSEGLFNQLREFSESKPSASFIGTIGASGGYITALGTDRIYARRNALTGSIGVLYQAPEFSGLLGKLGVGIQEVKSSPLKGGPSFYEPMDDRQRAVMKQMIDDSNNWFVDIVSDRRGMEWDLANELADGRVFTGGRAKDHNLIDEVGGEMQAIEWLREHEKVDADLPVVDYFPGQRYQGILGNVMSWLGVDELAETRLGLDGLLALWQPR